MLRKIANRIDPKTRPDGVAGFDQGRWGKPPEKYGQVIQNECQSACCIAGHAYILTKGSKEFLKYVNGEIATPIGKTAMEALGLNIDQRFALFHNVICGDEMKEEFGIDVDWGETENAEDIAPLLRAIADKYEGEER